MCMKMLLGVSIIALCGANQVKAAANDVAPEQASPQNAGLEEIIVTAQRRSESVNSVGLSITALSGDALVRRGVTDVTELAKSVPGLSISAAGDGPTIIYTLRGVGFNSMNLSTTPTVSVSVDEVPLPYPAMTQGATLDLERVEVLKGPQGTLFGQNSTGGQINYIAAKPTEDLSGRISATYGRFGAWNLNGFISGPLADGLKVRLAASHDGGGAWQKSYTRDDKLGKLDRTAVRFLLDYDAIENFRARLSVNSWFDKSDSLALQFTDYAPNVPPGLPQLISFPRSPSKPRAADWAPGKNFAYDTKFYQPALRLDFDLSDKFTLISTTSYAYYDTDSLLDSDGTPFEVSDINFTGRIKSFNQELRLTGEMGPVRWTVGGSLQRDKLREGTNAFIRELAATQNIGGTGFSAIESPTFSRQKTNAEALFANADIKIADTLSLVAGARYTKTKINFRGCNFDAGPPVPNQPNPGVTSSLAGALNIIYQALTGNAGVNPVQVGGCITLDSLPRNGAAPTFLPTESPQTLSEDNVAWNATLNFKPDTGTLLYARIAKGYKSGSFPTIGATASIQFLPVKQESLLAYEAGFKLTLLDRKLQLDGSAFYYDYSNKQLSNFVPDAVFGPLAALVNVPKSSVTGAEVSASFAPVRGLTLSVAGTYVKTKIRKFDGYDSELRATRDYAGERFNLAPKWSGNAEINYEWAVDADLIANIGTTATFRSSTSGIIGSSNPAYDIKGYTLVDAQAGIESAQGWSARLWAKNVFNKYYWTNAHRFFDVIARSPGTAGTYGVTLGYKF